MTDKKAAKTEPAAEAEPVNTPVTPAPVDTPAVYETAEDGSVQPQPTSPDAKPSPPPEPPEGAPAPTAETAPDQTAAADAERDARYRDSRGAQVIFDPESDASLGARGGAAGSIEGNAAVRDQHLLDNELDPRDPDATHLPANTVPPGGSVVDKVRRDNLKPVLQARQDKADADAAAKKQ